MVWRSYIPATFCSTIVLTTLASFIPGEKGPGICGGESPEGDLGNTQETPLLPSKVGTDAAL